MLGLNINLQKSKTYRRNSKKNREKKRKQSEKEENIGTNWIYYTPIGQPKKPSSIQSEFIFSDDFFSLKDQKYCDMNA